jgi:hypothetical protein
VRRWPVMWVNRIQIWKYKTHLKTDMYWYLFAS